jgi:hypothetical protein
MLISNAILRLVFGCRVFLDKIFFFFFWGDLIRISPAYTSKSTMSDLATSSNQDQVNSINKPMFTPLPTNQPAMPSVSKTLPGQSTLFRPQTFASPSFNQNALKPPPTLLTSLPTPDSFNLTKSFNLQALRPPTPINLSKSLNASLEKPSATGELSDQSNSNRSTPSFVQQPPPQPNFFSSNQFNGQPTSKPTNPFTAPTASPINAQFAPLKTMQTSNLFDQPFSSQKPDAKNLSDSQNQRENEPKCKTRQLGPLLDSVSVNVKLFFIFRQFHACKPNSKSSRSPKPSTADNGHDVLPAITTNIQWSISIRPVK